MYSFHWCNNSFILNIIFHFAFLCTHSLSNSLIIIPLFSWENFHRFLCSFTYTPCMILEVSAYLCLDLWRKKIILILTQSHSSISYSMYFIWCNLWILPDCVVEFMMELADASLHFLIIHSFISGFSFIIFQPKFPTLTPILLTFANPKMRVMQGQYIRL